MFVRAQRQAAARVIKSWALQRAIVEVDLAHRLRRVAELDSQIAEVSATIPDLETKVREAQDALNEARWTHTDLVNEARDVRVGKRDFGESARLAQGPDYSGWLGYFSRRGG